MRAEASRGNAPVLTPKGRKYLAAAMVAGAVWFMSTDQAPGEGAIFLSSGETQRRAAERQKDSKPEQGESTKPQSTADKGKKVWPIAIEDYNGISQCWGGAKGHAGIDIRIRAVNVPVRSPEDGTAYEIDYHNAAGHFLVIKHADDRFSVFEHLKKDSIKVELNKDVDANQIVATTGMSGTTTGPHLHYGESKDGKLGSYGNYGNTRNPLKWLPDDGRDTGGCRK